MHRPSLRLLFAGLIWLAPSACGLLTSTPPASDTASNQPELCCDGSMTAPPGAEADFDMTLSNPADTPIETRVVMRGETPGDWRIALCYEELCIAGKGEVEMDFDLAAGEALDIQGKFFIPEEAQPGQQATAAVAVDGLEPVNLTLDIVAE